MNEAVAGVIITLVKTRLATWIKLNFTKKLSQSVCQSVPPFSYVRRSRVNRCYNVVRSMGPYSSIAACIIIKLVIVLQLLHV